jgi:hypothetical protein
MSCGGEGVCNELAKFVEVDREAIMCEGGLKDGGDKNSIVRAIDEDLLESLANPSVKLDCTNPSLEY